MNNEQVAELFGEFNLGQQIAEKQGASHVVIRTCAYRWDIVFDIGNVHPKDRWEVWKRSISDKPVSVEYLANLSCNSENC